MLVNGHPMVRFICDKVPARSVENSVQPLCSGLAGRATSQTLTCHTQLHLTLDTTTTEER